MAGGHFYLGGGTAVQKATGHDDTADAMYDYLVATAREPELDKIRAYCDGSVEHFNWLEDLGFQFERSYYPGKVVVPGLDRAPEQMVTTPDNPAASLRAAAQSEAVPEAEPKAAAADPVPGADVPEAEVPSDTLSETMPATDADQAEDAPRGNRPQDNGPQDNGPAATADDTASRIPTQLAPATASRPAPGSDVAGQTGPARAPDLSLPPDIGALNLND